jgi:hypothetical protein
LGLAAAGLLLLNCSGVKTAPTTSDATLKANGSGVVKPGAQLTGVDALRDEARVLLERQAELSWRNWVYGDPLDLASTYQGHERLFSPPSIEEVQRQAAISKGDRQLALSFFRVYLAGELIGRSVAPLSDQVANLEAEETFSAPPTGEHPYRELDRLLANESSYQRRGDLYHAALSVVRKLNPLLLQKEEATQKLLPQTGYPTYLALGAAMRRTDLDATAELADGLLRDTEEVYKAAMQRQVQAELGLTLAGMRRADIPRFNRGPDLDAFFPADQMVPRLEATLKGMGIPLASQTNIRIDDAPLPKKNPRAVCFPVVVPTDIRLSVKPFGGLSDYRALFHETGHAEHYAHTETPVFEFQQLGDSAPTEAYAFVLESLISNPGWLAKNAGLNGLRLHDYLRGAAVKQLYLVRRYAGKLRFEIGWHRGAVDPKKLYQQELGRAYGFPVTEEDAERYLVDHDDFFYSADYLRAWVLAAQIQDQLVQRFGPTWWEKTEAGDFLKSLWRHGNQRDAEEIAKQMGAPGLSTVPLLRQLTRALDPTN